jgi:predicted ATP-grasp superfamily ATP-dependent carboligase
VSGTLLIVGASGRAAAASARRAGFEPYVIDLFADADTRRLAETIRCPIERYPWAIPGLAKRLPPGPFLYVGGLENRPDILAAIGEDRVLLGNGPPVLALVRDPFRLHELLAGKGLAHPWVNHPELSQLTHGRLLRKPLTGSGGFGIRFASADDVALAAESGADFYLQEFLPGEPMSAVCVTTGGSVQRLGLTRQLAGTDWLHAPPFRYAGNVGPIAPAEKSEGDTFWHAFRLSTETGVRGLWGFDFIPHAGEPHLIEVNPRYTASVEVLEYVFRTAFLPWHVDALNRLRIPSSPAPSSSRIVGKAVYYAPLCISFPASGPWDDSLARCTDVWLRPEFADIPDPGSVVEPGQPVLTILAESTSEAECLARLKSRAAELDQLFGLIPISEAASCSR